MPEEETALMKRCPQFDTCSAVDCPLDPYQGERGPEEPGEKCKAQKPTRLRVVAQARAEGVTTPLKYGGFSRREFVREEQSRKAKARYAALPEKEKQAFKDRLKLATAAKRQAAVSAD